MASAMLEKAAKASPAGFGRALTTYLIPIEGRDEWLLAARVRLTRHEPLPRPDASKRDCLSWAARGMTYQEIAGATRRHILASRVA